MVPSARLAALVVVWSAPVLAAEPGTTPARPRPNAALTEAFRDLTGAPWTCTGEMENPRSPGTQVKTRSEMRIRALVDGFAYAGDRRMEKNAAAPAGEKVALQWVWDEGKGKLLELGVDSSGTTWIGTSDGQKDGVLVWLAEGVTEGQPARVRTTITRKGPREVRVVSELENRGAWQKIGEDTCRR